MPQNRPKRKVPKTAYKPGQSGNPAGRPKSRLTALLAQHLGMEANGSGEKWEERLAKRVIMLADTGDKWALEFIWDRMEGKAPITVESGQGGVPAVFTLHLGDGSPK